MQFNELKWEPREKDPTHFMKARCGDRVYIEYCVETPDTYGVVELKDAAALKRWYVDKDYDHELLIRYWDHLDALAAQCVIHEIMSVAA
jgi:hypothetical protein